jgi:hypothetical protein
MLTYINAIYITMGEWMQGMWTALFYVSQSELR